MSSSGPRVQTCHIPPHVPLYIFSFPIVRILKFKHLHSISPLRSCPTTPNLGQARHGNNQTPYMQCNICRLCSAQLKMTPKIPPFRREFVRLLEIFSATLRRRSNPIANTNTLPMWNIAWTPPQEEISSAFGNAQTSKAVHHTATTREHVLKEFIMTGRKLMSSTFGSRRYGKTTTSWQMITRNDTEKQLLLSQDTDIPEAGISDIGTLMEQAISSSASESQEVNNKVQEIMSTVRDTFPRNVDNWERARSRSPRGSTAQLCDETTLQTPILPAP